MMHSRLFRTFCLLGTLFLLGTGIFAQELVLRPLGPQAQVSLVTMWPGSQIHIAFGHSAFRVKDPDQDLDILFNYGAFAVTDPLFIARFVQGELNYSLEVSYFEPYIDYYRTHETRRWDEQILDLSPEERQALFAFLINNARPENKFYRYDFIADNCATRPRDALEKIFASSLRFDPALPGKPAPSYRSLIDDHVGDRPLFQLAFYLVLGMNADRPVDARTIQFIPGYLMEALGRAKVTRGDQTRPLVASRSTILEPPAVVDNSFYYANPAIIVPPLALLALAMLLRHIWLLRHGTIPACTWWSRTADALLLGVYGLMGLLLVYLDWFSLHSATKGNLNLLWLSPLHLFAMVAVIRRWSHPFWRIYYAFMGIQTMVILALWSVWPQGMHPLMIAPMMLLVFRAASLFLHQRQHALVAMGKK